MKKKYMYIAGVVIAVAVAIAVLVFGDIGSVFKESSEEKLSSTEKFKQLELEKVRKEKTEKDKDGKEEKDKKDEKSTKSGKDTLLIYMIGSDLEARSGAGTDDLKEIENSGVDINSVNVLIYAGGSPKWHNDVASEKKNSVLHLTKKGFEVVKTMDSASMGNSSSLTEFLKYGHDNYPSDSYALILWDHGNGPIIGYGKDMLFDNDSLTLKEMQSALAQSPFGSQKKLAWIGFDACLMSSAELTCAIGEYADYLVASQEVEPSFGWNYDVVKDYGKTDTKTFLTKLIDGYIAACEDYYNKKGYENRDTTLACVDLSYAAELKNCINTLFAKASADMPAKYNNLVKQRVATRALGRASTGSEYDLIDLNDMALQMKPYYPEETSALEAVISKSIIKNGTNAQKCCGMSLYYPFYNKYYYENSWKSVYSELGVFSNYGEYLDKYQEIWLKEDNLSRYESSPVTQKVTDETNRNAGIAGTYKVHLTPQQNADYADAKFYILKNEKGEMFNRVMSSERVTNIDGVLYADFSGKAIFIKDNFNQRFIPVLTEHDTVGNIGRYSGRVMAGKEYHEEWTDLSFQMTLNSDTGSVNLNAILPRSADTKSGELTGGKSEEYSLSDFKLYQFPYADFSYITRYDSGLIRPIEEWVRNGVVSLNTFYPETGMEFVYENLDKDRYYIVFEITNTQGGKYCSEPLLIEGNEHTDELWQNQSKTDIFWDTGEKREIASVSGVTVYLKKGFNDDSKPVYQMEVKNDNEFPVSVYLSDLLINGDVSAGFAYVSVLPKSVESVSQYEGIPDESAIRVGGISEITSIKGRLTIEGENYMKLLKDYYIEVHISGEAKLNPLSDYYEPVEFSGAIMGARAHNQILYENEEVRITLLELGKSNSELGSICVENLSGNAANVVIDAFCVNGYTIDKSMYYAPVPHGKEYGFLHLSLSDITGVGIKQIKSLKMHISVYGEVYDYLRATPEESAWVDVNLSESGKDEEFIEKGKTVFDSDGVRILVREYAEEDNRKVWYATAVNNTDKDIVIDGTSDTEDAYLSTGKVGTGQRADFEITYYTEKFGQPLPDGKLSFNLHILDFYESELIKQMKEPLIITDDEFKSDSSVIHWDSADGITILDEEGVTVRLKKNVETGESVTDNYQYESYVMEAENKNSFPVSISMDDHVLNGCLQIDSSDYISNVKAGETVSCRILNVQEQLEIGALEEINSFNCSISIKNNELYSNIVEDRKINVSISGDAKIENLIDTCHEFEKLEVKNPYLDAVAERQVLWETENVRVTLLCFGETNQYREIGYLCAENLTSDYQRVEAGPIAINGITVNAGTKYFSLAPGCREYQSISMYNIEESNIESIESLSIYIASQAETTSYIKNPDASVWAEVKLKEKGKAAEFTEGKNVVFNKNGVRIIVDGYKYDFKQQRPEWYVSVINDSDNNVEIWTYSDSGAIITPDRVGAHQRVNATIYRFGEILGDSLSFKVELWDFYDNTLFEDDAVTVLPRQDETINLTGTYYDAMAEEQVLWESEKIRVTLLYFGKSNREEIGIVKLENLSDKEQSVYINAACINGITVPLLSDYSVLYMSAAAKETAYAEITLSEESMKRNGIESIESLSFSLIAKEGDYYTATLLCDTWAPVKLIKSGKATAFPGSENDGQIIFNKNGVKIIQNSISFDEKTNMPVWNVTIINDNDKDIRLSGVAYGWIAAISISDNKIGAHQQVYTEIRPNTEVPVAEVSFNFHLDNFSEEKVFYDDEVTTLRAPQS